MRLPCSGVSSVWSMTRRVNRGFEHSGSAGNAHPWANEHPGAASATHSGASEHHAHHFVGGMASASASRHLVNAAVKTNRVLAFNDLRDRRGKAGQSIFNIVLFDHQRRRKAHHVRAGVEYHHPFVSSVRNRVRGLCTAASAQRQPAVPCPGSR